MRYLPVITLFLLALPLNLASQEKDSYLQDPIDESLQYFDLEAVGKTEFIKRRNTVYKKRQTLERDFRKVLKGDIDFEQNRTSVDKFLNGFFLPRMTHYRNTNLEFGRDRDQLVRQYLGNAKRNDARDYILEAIILPYCKKICEGNYHPSSQVHAMGLIAALNRSESVKAYKPIPTFPMAEALEYMISTVGDDKPLHLKIAALQGIERHTSIDGQLAKKRINQTARSRIRDRMLKVLDSAYTGKKNQDDVTYFQQRIATRILGDVADPGANNEVAKKLVNMIANKKLKTWLRNDAVLAFAKLKLDNQTESIHLTKRMVNESLEYLAETTTQLADQILEDSRWIRENVLIFTGTNASLENIPEKRDSMKDPGVGGPNEGEFKKQNSTKRGKKGASNLDAFELPNYQLNSRRHQAKLMINTMVVAMAGKDRHQPEGMSARLNSELKPKVLQVAKQLRICLGDISDAPIAKTREAKSKTRKLEEQLRTTSEKLRQLKSKWVLPTPEHPKK